MRSPLSVMVCSMTASPTRVVVVNVVVVVVLVVVVVVHGLTSSLADTFGILIDLVTVPSLTIPVPPGERIQLTAVEFSSCQPTVLLAGPCA